MEEEDEIAVECSSNWKVVEGCLEGSVVVAKDSNGRGISGAGGRVVLVPTSEEYEPCELTVSFRGKLSYVRQLYVLSSARTLEIYSQGDEDNGADYVSTVRGTLISLSELETFTEAAEAEDDQRMFRSASSAGEGNEEPCLPADASEAENHVSHDAESGELKGEQRITFDDESLGGRSGASGGESFHVVHTGLPVEVTLEGVTLDQPLDQTDWVDCTDSPTKSSVASSDDEVDVNKCGFLLVDSDGENLVGKQQANDDGRDAVSESEPKSTGYEFSEEQTQQETIPKGEDATEQNESHPEFRSLSGVQIPEEDYEVERNESGESGVCDSGVQVGTTPVSDSGAEAVLVYEAELDVNSSDAWKSVKIRLLSLKDKSQLALHKVVINAEPGPSVSSLTKATTSGSFGHLDPGVGASSFLAMLGPGILQMARGLADSRRTSSLGLTPGGRKLDSDICPSLDSTRASLSVLHSRTTTREPTESDTSSSSSGRTTNDRVPSEESNVTSLNKEAHPTGLHSSGGEPWRTATGSGKNSNAGESFVESHQSASEGTENFQREELEGVDRGNHHEVSIVQRLDRLEAICLRMENFMTVALKDIDGRLKKMEQGIRGVIPESGEPWGTGSEPTTFVSASSVNVPPARRGEKSGSPSEKQVYTDNSAPGDSHAGSALPEEGTGSTANPDHRGFVSSTSPSLLSSVSPALPLRFSFPKLESTEFNSRVPVTSTDSRNPHLDESVVSGQNEEECERAEATYWAVQTFDDDTESDVFSEHSSSTGNEELDPCSCPESVSSSPSKSAQLVENLFDSVTSPSSVPFDATELPKHKNPFQEDEEEDSEDDDSFTSEKQEPLIDIDCITEETPQARTEEMFPHLDTIPELSEKEAYEDDTSEGGLNKDVFWASEAKELESGGHIDWQDDLFGGMERNSGKTSEKNQPVFDITEDLLLDTSVQTALPFVGNFATYDLFPVDSERGLREEQTTDVEGGNISMEFEQAVLPDDFVQEVPSAGEGEGEGDILGYDVSWGGELNHEILQVQDNVAVADVTVKDILSSLDPPEEMLLKDEPFPEEWNWFTSEVRSASNKENLPLDPSVNGECGGLLEVEEDDVREVPSLLDEDMLLEGRGHQLRVDVYSNGWVGPKTLSSLLDDDPPIAFGGDLVSDKDYPGHRLQQLKPRSLLDEDMFNPPKKIIAVIEEEFLNSPQFISSEEQYDLSGVIRMPRSSDAERSPSSGAPNLNSFNDDCTENVKLEHQNLPARDLLEDFGEESHELDRPDSEYTQTLLFHLSL